MTPLTEAEVQKTAQLIQASKYYSNRMIFSSIELAEPPKDDVRAGKSTLRRAFAVVYDTAQDQTYEAIADLTGNQLTSWKLIVGAEPPLSELDAQEADRIAREDPRWQHAMSARGIAAPDAVVIIWPAGYFGPPQKESHRLVRATFYRKADDANLWAHPIEGVTALIDLTGGVVAELQDEAADAPIPAKSYPLRLPKSAMRAAAAPLEITQSRGPGFQIENGEVRWEKWRFRYALQSREGLVLYTVGYDNQGKTEPILYRASLSEMLVPYGDPAAGWYFRNTLDAGEMGLGTNAIPLKPVVDCPDNCRVFDAVFATSSGAPHTIPGAVALFERDSGIVWKHGLEGRRGRELVLFSIAQAGNYDYGFEWIFRQDGSLEMRVTLTGIMSVKAIADAHHDAYSHTVGPNLAAVHHQHFFVFRLDFDVDGPSNRVVEVDTVPAGAGASNQHGGAFTMRERILSTEQEGRRNLDLSSSRRWIIQNAGVRNELGQAPGYALLPGENAVSFAEPQSWIRKRAGFLDAHLWVTPYSPDEMYAGGAYPNQSRGDDGIAKWTQANRPIKDRDIVVWYTMGITHNPRPEDWPVMPSHTAGFKLVPWSFFTSNPALDLPPRQ